MAFNMAWFKAQEEKKKAEELARKKAENPDYIPPVEEKKKMSLSRSVGIL